MMTQSSGATGATGAGAAVLVGASADGSEGAGAELQRTPGGANPAPFSQALLALAAGTDPASTLLAAASAAAAAASAAGAAGATVPTGSRSLATAQGSEATTAPEAATAVDVGEAMPKDLLLALFAATDAAPEAGGALCRTVLSGSDGTRAAAAVREIQAETTNTDQSATTQAAPADPGAALLAAVLQWLQQQHAGGRDASEATSSGSDARESDSSPTGTATVAAAMAVPIADGGTVMAGAGRADGAIAAGTMLAAAPGATLSGQLESQRDGNGRATSGDQPRAAAIVADGASGAGADASAGLDMAAALRAASEASPTQVERSVAVPVHERHWPTALATQVLLLSNDKVQAATLRLSPAHLGPVEVRIDMQESNVNVSFTAAHAETRAALEQAMPQLRAVLAGAGLSLGQATVQQQARRESQNPNALPRTAGTADEPIEAPLALARTLGMIDEYV
jgi:flagellar hook-length control protein FliK